jgi:nuclease S1
VCRWVGEVHQPLHVSFEDDRGGNGVEVVGGLCDGNLHGVWDWCIVERTLGTSAAAVAGQLRAGITDQQRSEWLASGPTDWANESFAITTSSGLGYCVRTDAGCWYDNNRERLQAGAAGEDRARRRHIYRCADADRQGIACRGRAFG